MIGLVPALVLSATLTPNKAAMLVPITVTVSITNRERKPATLELPTPDLFFVQVKDPHGKLVFDSRTGHKPIPVHRTINFVTGTTRLASFDWSGLNEERRVADVPGTYTIHVEMETISSSLVADVPLALGAPEPIGSVLAAVKPSPATIAGEPERQGTTTFLRDESGKIALSRPLGIFPQGRFIVRGTLERTADGQQFVIDRFAPAAENLHPQGSPTPLASATPK